MRHDIHGVIVVDKPAGITSAGVVAEVKRLSGARKVGHAGTLDPLATGVLVCCINKATKLTTFFLQGRKKYAAVLHLGVETDTQDSTGAVIATCNDLVFSEGRVTEAVNAFVGCIEQIPPAYSALKYKGVPLYKLARSGLPVAKPPRRVCISSIEIKSIALPMVSFDVSCSAGTYVRTLCADIGKYLGCGGHLKSLRRVESSGFSIEDAAPLSELKKLARSEDLPKGLAERVVTMADALPGIPEIVAEGVIEKKILNGNPLRVDDVGYFKSKPEHRLVKAVDSNRNLLAVLCYHPASETYRYQCVFRP